MGASREKRTRKTLPLQDTGKKNKKKEDTSSPTIKILAGFVIVLITLGALMVVLYATHTTQRMFTAMKVGGIKVSPAEYDVYYHSEYNYWSQYYSYYGYDISSDDSFPSYIQQQTQSDIQSTVSMAAEARKAGMKLSDENQSSYNDAIDSLLNSAKDQDMSVNQYLGVYYGAGVTRSTYEKYLTDSLLSSQWTQERKDALTYTQADYDKYYSDNVDNMDTVNYLYYEIPVATADDTSDTDAVQANIDAAKATADDFLSKAISEAAFKQAAIDFASDDKKASYENNPDQVSVRFKYLSDLTEFQRTWMIEPGRKAGDSTVLENTDSNGAVTSYQIFYFLSRQRADYDRVNVRHILFMYKDDSDANTQTPTDEQRAAAVQKAQDELDKYLAGDQTADAFAALANADTEDTGNTGSDGSQNGGLYEGVYKGQMVLPFEDWCFDPARKPGDTGLVETVYGVHVMYFVSTDDQPDWTVVAHDKLVSDDMDAYRSGINDAYPLVTSDYGMSLTLK